LPIDLLPRHIDTVIHAAGLVGQIASSSQLYQRVNVDATRELAEYAVSAGASRFVFLSTGGIYQPSEQRLTEESAVSPQDAYATSKRAAESVLSSFDSEFAVQVLRLFFPFGPTQQGRLIPNLIEGIRQGRPVSLMNVSGQPVVTPIFIDDLVEYVRRVLDIPDGLLANVAGDEAVSIRGLADMIGKTLGRNVAFEVRESQTPCNWCGSNDLISRLTDYSPRVTLELGLERIIGHTN
jgi:nucleoside-diphosphate-sugar epimerase